MKGFKATYSEKYKKGGAVIRKDCLPKAKDLPFIEGDNAGEIVYCEIIEAGVGRVEGKRHEYQIIKLFVESPDSQEKDE